MDALCDFNTLLAVYTISRTRAQLIDCRMEGDEQRIVEIVPKVVGSLPGGVLAPTDGTQGQLPAFLRQESGPSRP
jgi:hypothetical protein